MPPEFTSFVMGVTPLPIRKRLNRSERSAPWVYHKPPANVGHRPGVTCSKIEAGPGKTSLDPYGLLRSAANPGSVGYGRSNAALLSTGHFSLPESFRVSKPTPRRWPLASHALPACRTPDRSLVFASRINRHLDRLTVTLCVCCTAKRSASSVHAGASPQFQTPRYATGSARGKRRSESGVDVRNPRRIRSKETVPAYDHAP